MSWDICEAAQALDTSEGPKLVKLNDTQVFGTLSDTFGLYRDVTDCGFSVLMLVKGNTMCTLC